MRCRPRSIAALSGLIFLAAGLQAQVNTGNLSGLVVDPTGAIVSGAGVTVTAPATGYTRAVHSEGDGNYLIPDLPIGRYNVAVTAAGFSTLNQEVSIGVGMRMRLDFHLQVGAATQTVNVEAKNVSLSQDDASIGTLVTSDTISGTPLFLRNWDDLLRTVPGVQINRYTNQAGATSSGRTGSFNVNGVHSLQNDFILDGIDNNTFSENVQELSTESAHPSVDVISQFNVITNPYSAEYGRSPGAVVSVNTRSGSNKLHGTVYEYVRNQYFDSFDYFTKRTQTKKAEDNQNQFGASLGGPIQRDHLFFFFNYEGTRIKQGLSRISTVPLDNERIGDFSAAAASQAGVGPYPTIYNLSTCPEPINIKTCTPAPLVNNSFQSDPNAHIDTAVAKLIALFPEPNYKPGSSTFPDNNNYSRTGGSTDFNDSYDARIDWAPSSSDTVFVRYNYFNRTRSIPGYLGGLADGTSTSAWGNQILKGNSVVLGWTRILSPRMVNDFRLGWVRDYSFASQQPFSLSQLAGSFLPGVPDNPSIGGGVPLTTFSNHSNAFVGSPDFLPKQQVPMLWQYNDTLSWELGRHNLKAGVTLFLPMRNLFQDEPGMRGDLTFTGVFSGLGSATQGGTTNARDYADGLFGATQSDQLTNVFFVDQRLWMASGFIEDDWKVTPRLTLNLGLRYDFAAPAVDGKNRMANFNPAGSGSLVFAKSGSLGDRALVDPNTTDFGPRIGISYSLDSNTVLRAGYGVYYTVFERIGSEDELALNPPNLINKTQASNTQSVIVPEIGFPSNYLDPSTINLNSLQAFHIRSINPVAHAPMVQQWSGGIQRQIGNNWLAEVDYVGTKSTHLDVIYDYNQPIIQGNQNTGVIPYPNFGQVEYTTPIGFGNYNGLQASLRHAMHNGLSFGAAYTWSRSLDNTPEELENNSGDAPNGRNYAAWYGPSDFNVPQRLSANYVYDLPFGHGKQMLNSGPLSWIFGNWRTSGVYTFYSGHPFTASWGSESSLLDPYGYATAVPNVVGKVHYLGSTNCWFYTAANSACKASSGSYVNPFVDAGKNVIGNGSRNSLRGPQTQAFDAALIRNIPIHESWSAEARWEVFNVANHALFGQPGGNISSGSAAQITTLSGDPRVMQFAVRLNW
ncbi:TonB-dependent receptor [Paracidobacterium acidisoli]|uniref:TonB-dependent receptor n=1 Tax=Paracidobacterium acidisoli TaxID=2303751 RepID=A0A372IKX2_9BACT|nr:carboxypeptidase regulatory-like domain-containing protein [Paracidobacterium acidisoli]MBT9332701.1 carboxypeptidase regulatory-like domain-containing protein [Paracidobacterium acidisoli]